MTGIKAAAMPCWGACDRWGVRTPWGEFEPHFTRTRDEGGRNPWGIPAFFVHPAFLAPCTVDDDPSGAAHACVSALLAGRSPELAAFALVAQCGDDLGAGGGLQSGGRRLICALASLVSLVGNVLFWRFEDGQFRATRDRVLC